MEQLCTTKKKVNTSGEAEAPCWWNANWLMALHSQAVGETGTKVQLPPLSHLEQMPKSWLRTIGSFGTNEAGKYGENMLI